MAQDAKAPEKEAAPAALVYPARGSVRAVFGGPMVNPLTEDRFVGEPSKPVDIDAWIKVQIEAGKLEICE